MMITYPGYSTCLKDTKDQCNGDIVGDLRPSSGVIFKRAWSLWDFLWT